MAESQEDNRMDGGQQEESMDRNQRYVYSFLRNITPDEGERLRLEKYCCHADMPFQAMIEIGLAVRDGLPDQDIELLCAEVDSAAANGAWQFLQKQRITSANRNIYMDKMLTEFHDQSITIQEIQEFLLASDQALQEVDRNILQVMQQIQELQENDRRTREETSRQMSQLVTILQENWKRTEKDSLSSTSNMVPCAEYNDQDGRSEQDMGGMVFVDEEELDAAKPGEESIGVLDETIMEEADRVQEHDDTINFINREESADGIGGWKLQLLIQRLKSYLAVRKEQRKRAKRARKNALSKMDKEKLIQLLCEHPYDSDQMKILEEMIKDVNFNGSDMEQIIMSGSGLTANQLRQKIDLLRQIKQSGKE